MKRRITKQGIGGGTIYLPKKWMRRRGIKPGDDIDITEVPRGLLIQTSAKPERKEGKINFNFRNARFLEYALTDYYRAGFDRITLPISVKQKDVQKPLNFLPGFEISKTEKEEIVIEMLTEPAQDRAEHILKQVFFILEEELNHIAHCIKKAEKIDFSKIEQDSTRMVRHINLFMRAISKNISDLNDFYWSLVNLLHQIGRQAYYLATELSDRTPVKIDETDIEYIESVIGALGLLYDGIYKDSYQHLEKIHTEISQYKKTLDTVYGKSNAHEIIIMTRFSTMYRLILYATGAAIGVLASAEGKN